MRTSAHGISAGVAKVGALWASVWFNYLPSRTKFWTTSSFNFGGLLLTALFMPDPVRMLTHKRAAAFPAIDCVAKKGSFLSS